MMYFAAENSYGSPSSTGFSNTWEVLAFDSKLNRDNWVDSRKTLSARAIARKDIHKYVDAPRPFSGEFRGILDEFPYNFDPPEGFIGTVDVLDNNYFTAKRLNRR